MKLVLCVLLATLLLPTMVQAKRKNAKALRVLKLVRQVDGPGSGIDADTVRGTTPLIVVDANGTFMGAPIFVGDPGTEASDHSYVVRRIEGRPVGFWVVPGGFAPVENPYFLYYSTSDCSGTVYLTLRDPASLFPEDAFVNGALMYYPDVATASVRTMQTTARFAADASACFNGAGSTPRSSFLPTGAARRSRRTCHTIC